MKIALVLLVKIFCYSCLISIMIGFIRPVYVLWFLDRCNRLKVLQLYGSLALFFFILYQLLSLTLL
ncbi:hypothetical protein [Echinicola sediminis]